jgi:small subunit ribosomal protein S17e
MLSVSLRFIGQLICIVRRKLKLSPITIWNCSCAFKRRTLKIVDMRNQNLGKVKTDQVKRAGKELLVRFPEKFTTEFEENKRLVNTLTKGTTTRVRNQIAGYITRTKALAQADSEMDSDMGEDEEDSD